MNLQKIGDQLDVMLEIYGHLTKLEEPISALDRDFFLQAIRQLYALCLLEEKPAPEIKPVEPEKRIEPIIETPVETPKPQEKKTAIVFTHLEEELTPTEKVLDVKKEELVKTVVIETPKVEEPKTMLIETPKVEEPKTMLIETPKVEEPKTVIIETPKVEEPKTVLIETPKVEEPKEDEKRMEIPQVELPKQEEVYLPNVEYDELFTFQVATDLSQKLGEKPIADLDKAISVGDKFLYMNQLFGGDAAAFKACREELQKRASLDQARQYLEINCIDRFQWMDKNRKSSARDFVKLVRRLYLK